jgi:hypothetical protein
MVELFQNDDEGYRSRLANHPEGFVLQTGNTRGSNEALIHTARCHSIVELPHGSTYTAGAYIKVCSDDRGQLRTWVRKNRERATARECQLCLG